MPKGTTGKGLTPFNFEGAPVRVVQISGEPHFVGKDVAERLGYADPTNAIKQHCRGVVKRHPIVDALGRSQEARIISEPDVLRLIVKSNLPAAERFERWVFEDVLPSIRKTGAYASPGADGAERTRIQLAREARLTFNEQMRLCRSLGITGQDAIIAANHATKNLLGIDRVAALGVKHREPETDSAQINATTLGDQLGLDAKKANKALTAHGYQTVIRTPKGRLIYEPTEKGRATGGRVIPTTKKHDDGTPVTQLMWSMVTVEALRSDMKKAAEQ